MRQDTNRAAFETQAGYCDAMDAPITARVSRALGRVLDRTTRTGARVLDWPGEPVADAVVLRLVGGLHALARRGDDAALARLFAGEIVDDAATDAVLAQALAAHDAALAGWLDGPPQTNETARAAGLMTGLLHVAQAFGPRVEVLEIGSSAGLNLLLGRMRFDLGGVTAGPADSPLALRPDWRGVPPPAGPIAVVRTRGVDIAPIDLSDAAQAERLAAYVWADAPERQARLATAIAMVRAAPVALARGDAADWLEARLHEPQEEGVARVLVHSVVWQYLPAAGRARIVAAMAAAGARATPRRPLGWVMAEPNRTLHRHELRSRGGPSRAGVQLVGLAHAHGAWVEGLAPPYATRDEAMLRGAYE